MKIGIGQMNTQDNKSANLTQAEKLIDRLAVNGAQMIMLPEYFHFLGPDEEKPKNAELMDGPSLDLIRRKAVEHKVHVHLGSFLETDGQNIYNTSVVFDPHGEIIAKYRKVHLFDVETPGGFAYKESATITPAGEVVTFKVNDITFGLSVCYDLRFPEFFRRLMKKGAQVILLPAAFTLQTGRDHWELLLRARAVENLCWVVAAAQWGPHPPNHTSFGRSMIINPWGIVVAQAPDGVSHLIAEINIDIVNETRTIFPALDHVREDLFPL